MSQRHNKRWHVVSVLFFIACLNYADRTAISAVFPLLRSELGVSDVGLAAIGSFFLWSYAIGSPFAGRLADRVSRSNMVVYSLIAWSVITMVTALVANTDQLLVTRVLLGIAECAYLPAAIALIADHHSAETRATAMGVHLAGLNFGLVAGGAFAGYLGEHYGWRTGFMILGGVGLALAAVAHFLLCDVTSPAERRAAETGLSVGQTIKQVLMVRSYLVVLAESTIIAIGIWMFFNWLPLYYRETFQMSLTGAGFSGTFMLQMAATIGVIIGGYLSDRIAGKHLHRRMLFQALCYLAAAPFLFSFLGSPSYGFISASIFSFALLRAVGASNEHAIVCDLLPANLRSTAVGLQNSANCMAGGAGILIAGYLKATAGLAGIFAGVSVLVLVAAAVVLCGYLFFIRKDLALVRSRSNSLVLEEL
jgi:MFS family permease